MNDILENRLGADRISVIERAAMVRLQSPSTSQPTIERFERGEADQVLSEAANLAASDAVRETIERADQEELSAMVEAETQAYSDASPGSTIGSDIEEVGFTKEELDAMWFLALQYFRILAVAFFAGMAISAPAVSPEQVGEALGAILALLDFINVARNDGARK
jgi:hypothetical protein